MDLPVIETPVFPRWVWIEEITYSHIPIATIVTAFMLLAPIFEYIAWRRHDPRWERLSKSFIWFSMILFSPGAALGTGIPMFIIGTYPEFWSRWANLFFWPLIVQFCFFLIEVFFLFFMYYLTWDRWQNRKRLHISMGACAAFFGYMVQVVWDALGSYMMTPGGVALPGVDQPVGFSLPAMLNPSFPFLLIHRTFGNFSYVLLLTGGVLALRYLGQKRKNPSRTQKSFQREHYLFPLGFGNMFYNRIFMLFCPACHRMVLCPRNPARSTGRLHGHHGRACLFVFYYQNVTNRDPAVRRRNIRDKTTRNQSHYLGYNSGPFSSSGHNLHASAVKVARPK
ncbi:MAG: cytochrome ubiquinol oxidase subunit I [Planctomycetota bacterium]|jgi:hypothetical protein